MPHPVRSHTPFAEQYARLRICVSFCHTPTDAAYRMVRGPSLAEQVIQPEPDCGYCERKSLPGLGSLDLRPASVRAGWDAHFLHGGHFAKLEVQQSRDTETRLLPRGPHGEGKGQGKNWRRTGTLYWNAQAIDRFSQQYQELLDRAFEALFAINASARKALVASGDAKLDHSMGKRSPKETVLTRSEFCSRLNPASRKVSQRKTQK
jgi:hypothetical protein